MGQSGRRLLLALVTTVLGAAASALVVGPDLRVGTDDANIYLVYARNLVAGHGFTFGPGLPPSEGVTSVLWTLVATAVHPLPGPPELALHVLSLGLLFFAVLAALVTLGVCARELGLTRVLTVEGSILLCCVLLLFPGFFGWMSFTLMDTALWGAGVAALVALLAREVSGDPGSAGALVSCTVIVTLTRPEALLLVPALLLLGAVVHPRGNRRSLRTLRAAGAAFVVTAVALLAFRLVVFGYPLPNTFYAKVPPDLGTRLVGGLQYLRGFFTERPLRIVLGAITAQTALVGVLGRPGGGSREQRPSDSALSFTAGAALIVMVTAVLAGGDAFPHHRFLQPATPLLIIVGTAVAGGYWGRSSLLETLRSRRLAVVFASIAFISLAFHAWDQMMDRGEFAYQFKIAAQGRALGAALGDHFPTGQEPPVGMYAIGGFALKYPGDTRDLLGLTWEEMAQARRAGSGPRNHAAFDESVFWSSPPPVMLPRFTRIGADGPIPCSDWWTNTVLRNLPMTAAFRREYAPAVLRREAGPSMFLFLRRSWLRSSAAPPSGLQLLPIERCAGMG